jgi:hypothetical protein
MVKPVVFLVGDTYRSFAQNSHVVTLRDLRERVAASDARLSDVRVVAGQGMRHEDGAAPCDPDEARSVGILVEPAQPPAPLAMTHKRDPEHVLVTTPTKLRPRTYGMDLLLTDRMDRLVDHVTGQHVSGMVLLEAARQGGIACVELEYLSAQEGRFGFVWNGSRVNFTRFAFPLPTRLVVSFREEAVEGRSQPKRFADIEILQAGHSVCQVEMAYDLLPTTVFDALEAKAARRAVKAARELFEEEASLPQLAASDG